MAEAFAQAMRRIVSDCEDRPGEERARCLNLQCEFTPVMDQEGHCSVIESEFQIKESIPTRRSKIFSFGVKAGGKLFFSDEDPSNVNQLTFGDVNPASGRAERPLPDDQE